MFLLVHIILLLQICKWFINLHNLVVYKIFESNQIKMVSFEMNK